MPSLNPDILEEVIPNFNFFEMGAEKSLDAIKNFMLSGKEPYQAVLRYFSSVDCVSINSFRLLIYVKKMITFENLIYEKNPYIFPFDFLFFEDVLKVVIKSNKKLEIEAYPMNVEGRRILATLIHKDLKYIAFDSSRILPSDYYKFFKNECKFDDVRLILCCSRKPIPDEFFELASTHRSFTTHFENFILKMPDEGTFPAIENLSFDPCFCEHDYDDYGFIFNTENVNSFLTFLSKSMPNLKKLNAQFVARPQRKYSNWDEVYYAMIEFFPNIFKNVAPQIKGSLWFCAHDSKNSFKNAVERLGENPEIHIDFEKKCFIKKFSIHEGLSFEFVLQFNEEEVDSDNDSSNEYGGEGDCIIGDENTDTDDDLC
uniref:DUF38 domain-containing protein n=1 Tax=Panagrolaimus sp. PS1159 TaxID=55785 RepID=A0AC35F974_9BILA